MHHDTCDATSIRRCDGLDASVEDDSTLDRSSSPLGSIPTATLADHEGHHPRRGHRVASASGHLGHVEAVAPGLRQADDLLPAVGADARRHPRGAGHHHAGGSSRLRTAARRRITVGNAAALRHAARPRGARPSVPDRRRLPRRAGRIARPRRQHVLRRRLFPTGQRGGGPRVGRHRVRLPREGSAALRHRRPRRRRPTHQDRGKARVAAQQLGGHRAVLLRRTGRRSCRSRSCHRLAANSRSPRSSTTT